MDTNMITLILWAPFGFVMLVAGLVYLIKGLRRGVLPALASLLAVLVSALVSIFGARLLAGIAAPRVVELLPPDMMADAGAMAGMMTLLVSSLIQTVIALVLFALLFFWLTPMLGALCKYLQRRWLPVNELTAGSRWGGAAVGLVCAFLYTVALLLPLYGTLAAYAPAARSLLETAVLMEQMDSDVNMAGTGHKVQRLSTVKPVNNPQPNSEMAMLLEILDKILEHPLVTVSSSAPVQAAYSSITQVQVEDSAVSISDMAVTLEEATARFNALKQADESQQQAMLADLIRYCREELLTQEWVYAMYGTAMEELPAALAAELPEEPIMAKYVEQAIALLDLDRAAFEKNGAALLDFAAFVLEHDLEALVERDEPYQALRDAGFVTEIGKLINATDELHQAKVLFYRFFLEAVASDFDKPLDVDDFATRHPLEQFSDPALQEQEAEAFMVLLGMSETQAPAQFLALHPSLGQPVMDELMQLLEIK